jgi:hypothetical protein
MPYAKQTWANDEAGGTKVNATRMSYIEEGIETATEIAEAAGAGADALDDLTDVTIVTPEDGHTLKYNGTSWVNAEDAGGATTAAELPFVPAGDLTSENVQDVILEHAGAGAPHPEHEKTDQKGIAGGYAGLGLDGKVPAGQLPASVTGQVDWLRFSFDGPVDETQVTASEEITDASVFTEYRVTAENSGPVGGTLTINIQKRDGGNGQISTVLPLTMNDGSRKVQSAQGRTDAFSPGDEMQVEVIPNAGITVHPTKVMIVARRTV